MSSMNFVAELTSCYSHLQKSAKDGTVKRASKEDRHGKVRLKVTYQ